MLSRNAVRTIVCMYVAVGSTRRYTTSSTCITINCNSQILTRHVNPDAHRTQKNIVRRHGARLPAIAPCQDPDCTGGGCAPSLRRAPHVARAWDGATPDRRGAIQERVAGRHGTIVGVASSRDALVHTRAPRALSTLSVAWRMSMSYVWYAASSRVYARLAHHLYTLSRQFTGVAQPLRTLRRPSGPL